MNIAIINKHLDDALGGSELQCDYIATELSNRGYRVTYFAVDGTERDYNKPYHVVACDLNAEDIKAKLFISEPDIIYWRFNKHFFYPVVKSAYKKKIPFIFAASSVNDVNPWYTWHYRKNIGFRGTIRRVVNSHRQHRGYKYVSAVTVNNKEYLDGVTVKKRMFIPNGMSREYVPFNWDRPYCAWVSNIKQIKRPEFFMNLAGKFKERNVDFLMVGAIQDKDYQWIEDRNNLPENLHYLGFKTPSEVNGILKRAEIHIHTCFPEGFPNVFIQAWIQGTPSISYGFDPSGYIEENEIGFHTHENWQLFLEKTELLVQNSEMRKKMGDNAYKFANDLFSISKAVDKLEKLMIDLLKK